MSDAVVVQDLVKRFGETTALDGISVAIGEGELFGFIGPDGGGKTTLFRILATLLLPDGGSASVLGHDVVRDLWALRQEIGYMPGRFSLYGDLSVEENIRFFASVFGTTLERERARIASIYDQLAPFADRRAEGNPSEIALALARWLEGQGVAGATVEPSPATIEDVFIDRMGAPDEAPASRAA